jgi:hypothetical protein
VTKLDSRSRISVGFFFYIILVLIAWSVVLSIGVMSSDMTVHANFSCCIKYFSDGPTSETICKIRKWRRI